MPKQRVPRDVNQNAKRVVDIATGEASGEEGKKNAAAVALGRLGGIRGGKVRAERLTKEQRHKIASAAARKRWARAKP